MKARALAAITAVLALAACGSSVVPGARTTMPAPAATSPSPSQAQAIDAARRRECTRFQVAFARVQSDTGDAKTAGALVAADQVNGKAWLRLLSKADRVPDTIPEGSNSARGMAVRIAKTAYDVSMLNLDVARGELAKVKPAWHVITREMNTISADCTD